MALTGAQFITKVLNRINRDGTEVLADGSTTISDLILDFLNDTQLRLARLYSFPELDLIDKTTWDTVADTKTYTYNTIFGSTNGPKVMKILDIVLEDDTASRKLKQLSYRKIDRLNPYPEGNTSRKPVAYIDFKEQVELYPIPDDAYDMHVRASLYPTDLANDATASELLNKDDLIIAGTLVEWFNYNRDTQEAMRWKAILRDKLREVIGIENQSPDWSPGHEGFNAGDTYLPGDYHLDPFVMDDPSY